MHALWHWILYMLASTSADPQLLEHERARTAGAVNVAYASLAAEPVAPKHDEPAKQATRPISPPALPAAPKQPAAARCQSCNGTGRIYRPDGGWVKCQCGACPTGTCPKR